MAKNYIFKFFNSTSAIKYKNILIILINILIIIKYIYLYLLNYY